MSISQFSILVLLTLSFPPPVFPEMCHQNDKTALLQTKKDLWTHPPSPSGRPKPTAATGMWWHATTPPIELPNLISSPPISAALSGGDRRPPPPPPPLFPEHQRHRPNPTRNFQAFSPHFSRSEVQSSSQLSQLPKLLTNLLLDHNKLTCSIPESFAGFKQQDFYLYLGRNQLSGPMPAQLGSANFTRIDVSRNGLEADISFLFGKNKSLVVGDFSRNQVEFDLSKAEFSDSPTTLGLNHNKVYGGLPKDLASTSIVDLNVSYNRLCGRIPELGRFQWFDYTVFFHNKCLCGKPLPQCK